MKVTGARAGVREVFRQRQMTQW